MFLLIILSAASQTSGLNPVVEGRGLPFKLHLVGGQPERGSVEEDALVREYVRIMEGRNRDQRGEEGWE